MKDLLKLKREVVGVYLIPDLQTFQEHPFPVMKSAVSYCYMVKIAAHGQCLKASLDQFHCPGASTALGLMPLDERRFSGEVFFKLGLYENLPLAKQCQQDVCRKQSPTFGVILGPVNEMSQYDVAIIVDTPYVVMRIIQGYTYQYGVQKSFRLSGNEAICSECTAAPYNTGQMNISALCSGTRFRCKWEEEDMAVGIPQQQYEGVRRGVAATLNRTEPDSRKAVLRELNPHLDIRDRAAYFYDRE